MAGESKMQVGGREEYSMKSKASVVAWTSGREQTWPSLGTCQLFSISLSTYGSLLGDETGMVDRAAGL